MGQFKPSALPDPSTRSKAGMAAEHDYNASVTRGTPDELALRRLVTAHVETYPQGINPDHPRKVPALANGHDHE